MNKPAKASLLPLLIVLPIVGLIIVVGALYFFTKKGSLNASLPGAVRLMANRVTEKDFKSIEDPILRKHMVAQANTSSYRMKSTSSGLGEDVAHYSEIQLQGDDFTYRTWQEEKNKQTNEMIVMADTTYVKDYTDKSWWKQTVKPNDVTQEDEVQSTLPEDFKDLYTSNTDTTYKKLGTEPCDSRTCYKYEEVDKENPEGKRTFWFDTKDYLLRKEITGFGEFSSTNTYEYADVKISKPSPTKEVPEGKYIYEYLYTSAGSMNNYMPKTDTEINQYLNNNQYMENSPTNSEEEYNEPYTDN